MNELPTVLIYAMRQHGDPQSGGGECPQILWSPKSLCSLQSDSAPYSRGGQKPIPYALYFCRFLPASGSLPRAVRLWAGTPKYPGGEARGRAEAQPRRPLRSPRCCYKQENDPSSLSCEMSSNLLCRGSAAVLGRLTIAGPALVSNLPGILFAFTASSLQHRCPTYTACRGWESTGRQT
jgi:hypothetical protein